MRKKCIRCGSACAATARTPRRPRRMPFLRSGAGSTADRSHRFRRGSTVWRRTPASTRCGGEKNRAAASHSTTRSCLSTRSTPRPSRRDGRAPRGTEIIAGGLLSALPEEYRKVLILREIEGLSYTEIAESASIELGTVNSRISRGRSLLRNFLSKNGNLFEIASSKVTECNREEMSAK